MGQFRAYGFASRQKKSWCESVWSKRLVMLAHLFSRHCVIPFKATHSRLRVQDHGKFLDHQSEYFAASCGHAPHHSAAATDPLSRRSMLLSSAIIVGLVAPALPASALGCASETAVCITDTSSCSDFLARVLQVRCDVLQLLRRQCACRSSARAKQVQKGAEEEEIGG